MRLELTGVGRWRPGLGWVLARDSSSWRRRRCRHVSGAWGRCRRRRRLSSDSSWATAKCWSRKFGSALGCRWRCSDQSSFATSLCLSRIDSHLIVFYVGFFDDCGNWRSPLRITNRSKTDHFRFSLIVLFGAKRFLILAYHALLRDKKEEENWEYVTGIVKLQPDHFLILKFGPKKTVLVEKAVRKLLRRLVYLPLTQLTWSAMINLCSGNGLAWIEPAKERYKKFFYFSLWLISFSSWFDDDFSSLSSTSSQLKNFFSALMWFRCFSTTLIRNFFFLKKSRERNKMMTSLETKIDFYFWLFRLNPQERSQRCRFRFVLVNASTFCFPGRRLQLNKFRSRLWADMSFQRRQKRSDVSSPAAPNAEPGEHNNKPFW